MSKDKESKKSHPVVKCPDCGQPNYVEKSTHTQCGKCSARLAPEDPAEQALFEEFREYLDYLAKDLARPLKKQVASHQNQLDTVAAEHGQALLDLTASHEKQLGTVLTDHAKGLQASQERLSQVVSEDVAQRLGQFHQDLRSEIEGTVRQLTTEIRLRDLAAGKLHRILLWLIAIVLLQQGAILAGLIYFNR